MLAPVPHPGTLKRRIARPVKLRREGTPCCPTTRPSRRSTSLPSPRAAPTSGPFTFASTDARRRRGRRVLHAGVWRRAPSGGRSPRGCGPAPRSHSTAPRARPTTPRNHIRSSSSAGPTPKSARSAPGPPSTTPPRSRCTRSPPSAARRRRTSSAARAPGTRSRSGASTGIGHDSKIYLRPATCTRWPSRPRFYKNSTRAAISRGSRRTDPSSHPWRTRRGSWARSRSSASARSRSGPSASEKPARPPGSKRRSSLRRGGYRLPATRTSGPTRHRRTGVPC